MNIGAAAKASGISAKMLRHYEVIGLLPGVGRSRGNYRSYGSEDVHRLRFIGRARYLGFTMDQVRTLLQLWDDKDRASADVKDLALQNVRALDEKIGLLTELHSTLSNLAASCDGDDRPECPIIESLEEELSHARS